MRTPDRLFPAQRWQSKQWLENGHVGSGLDGLRQGSAVVSPFRSNYGDILTAIRYSHTTSRHRFLPSSFLALALFVILLDAGYSSARCQASAEVGPLPSYSMNTVNPSARTRSFLCLRLPGAFLFQAEFQWSFRPCRPLTSPRVVVSTAISGPFRP
ncbi:hypothetical protein F5144DRAFT_278685 [Chaetomium tenue]|uniref:Uncharacterized protein n=1 Tax=Chaetomium tenue TaxID=1854479 RepID=A0ACB7P5J3_9PEZI|nr:hypothetical protein F5144DRAFT_278685 [Chaetomium globosum]